MTIFRRDLVAIRNPENLKSQEIPFFLWPLGVKHVGKKFDSPRVDSKNDEKKFRRDPLGGPESSGASFITQTKNR
jgi:hypothetical protein